MSWQATGATVRGALHVRHGQPNQDAVLWSPVGGPADSAIIAVADGHGSNRCFRSQVGAALAVGAGLDVMAELLPTADPDADEHDQLPERLPMVWRAEVAKHLEREPFTTEELALLEEVEGAEARLEVEAGPALAYGTTLLLAGVNEQELVVLQVGDGDILLVDAGGDVTRPLPPDRRSVGNETASLARWTASEDARVRSLNLGEQGPVLILAATDGYANSFAHDSGFLQVGSDLLRLIRSEGLEAVHDGLEGWLAEASELGSGDDVTVGLLVAGSP